MDTLACYRNAIAVVFRAWEQLPGDPATFRIAAVLDTVQDRYTLTHIDEENGRTKSRLLAQLEVRDGKIWVLTDNTEEGIADELVEHGIPKDRIVLGYFTPAYRAMGEFATA